ncbi:MAG TPA: PAS domain S-box protein [Nitrospiraceae bacterium]|nr:PAS domain S-box protein [Nitrospiraceae bacterium]
MRRLAQSDHVAQATIGASFVGIFLLDLFSPPDVAVWSLYLFPLWLARRSSNRWFPIAVAVVGTGLIVAGYVLSPPGAAIRFALVNRALGVLTLWTLALLARRRVDMDPRVREHDTFFASFMRHLPAFAWVKTPDGRYMYANKYFCEVFGLKPDKVFGRTDVELFPPDTARQFVENDRYVLTADQELQTVETFRIDGRPRYSLVRKFPIREGNATRLIGGVAIDMTDAKLADEALQESRERFGSAFRDAAIGMALVGTDGRWLQVNRALCQLVGYSEEELLATTFQAITHPDDLDTDLGYVNQMLHGEIPTYQMEKRYIHKLGHVVWILLSVSLVRDQDGRPLYFISQIQDITERKRALEQLQAAHDRLRDVTRKLVAAEEEERRRLSRELHDEFGQALTCLKFDLVAVIKGLSQSKAAVGSARLIDKVRAMANLVDGIIESTRRIATGLRPSILDELGLAAAVAWQAHHFQTHTGLVCETAVDPRLAATSVEPTLSTTIFRILQELLTNVQRHAQATRVRITLYERDRTVILSVQDNGKGIEPVRIGGSSTLGIRGIQERATLLGGEFSLRGEPGRGTWAEVKLPRQEITKSEGCGR